MSAAPNLLEGWRHHTTVPTKRTGNTRAGKGAGTTKEEDDRIRYDPFKSRAREGSRAREPTSSILAHTYMDEFPRIILELKTISICLFLYPQILKNVKCSAPVQIILTLNTF